MPASTISPMTRARALRCAPVALLAAVLPGCLPETEPIQVSLNNRTQTSITAHVVLERIGGEDQTLNRTPIPAGETRRFGPYAPPERGRLQLVIERDDQFSDVPTRRTLRPGSWSWRVVRPVFSTYSSIELQDEPNGEGAWEWAPRSMDSVAEGRNRRDF